MPYKRAKAMFRIGEKYVAFAGNLASGPDYKLLFSQFNTVIVWCETFVQFITSAEFR